MLSPRVLWLQTLQKGFGSELRDTLQLLHATRVQTFEQNAQLDYFHIKLATKAWTVYQELMPNLELSLQDKCARHICELLRTMLKQCSCWSDHFVSELTSKQKNHTGGRCRVVHLNSSLVSDSDDIRWCQRMKEVRKGVTSWREIRSRGGAVGHPGAER